MKISVILHRASFHLGILKLNERQAAFITTTKTIVITLQSSRRSIKTISRNIRTRDNREKTGLRGRRKSTVR